MLNEKQYEKEIAELKKFNDKEGYVPLNKISEMFPDASEDLLDDVVTYLENINVEVTREDEVVAEDISDDLDDAFNEDADEDPDDSELRLEEEETDIKVSDFDNVDSSNYPTDDIIKMYLHEIGQIELLDVKQEVNLARSVQAGLMAKEQLEKQGKKLSEDEVQSLQKTVKKGKEAQDILVESNLRLVVSIAKRYIGRGLQLSDLIQEGNLGLMKAVLKFDHSRGFKFSTYATWWIRQAITRAIADKGRNVRIPVHMVECINRLARTKRALVQEYHREPTIEEIANRMKLPVDKIVELQRVSQDSVSFDTAVGDEEDSTLIDLIADTDTLNPLEYTEKELYSEEINEVLQTLTPREETVIRLRYGIGVDRSHTLEEVGKIMGVTRERVRQIESKALIRLRHHTRMNRLKQHI